MKTSKFVLTKIIQTETGIYDGGFVELSFGELEFAIDWLEHLFPKCKKIKEISQGVKK